MKEDEAVRDYIRMWEDHKDDLKRIKQRINAFCARHSHVYRDGHHWTRNT